MIESPIYRPTEAAEYLRISRSYLYALCRQGEIARLKLGGRAAGFHREDLDAWLNRQRAAAKTA